MTLEQAILEKARSSSFERKQKVLEFIEKGDNL